LWFSLSQQRQWSFGFAITSSANNYERGFGEAFRLKPRFAASTSVPRGGKLGHYAFELVIRACSEKCGSVSAELFAEQKRVFTRDKRFQLSPSLEQWSVTKVLAVQVEKVESAED
jgi:hypothetical protein